MQTADLYLRVGRTEQDGTKYSLSSQEELLRRYCAINNITIRKVIFEVHSAKTFDRPEWQKYLSELREHKGQADLLLFLTWDRFSRNAGDTHQMINILKELGIEPQAIGQSLNLAIPESKIRDLLHPKFELERRRRSVNHLVNRKKLK